MNKPKHYKKSGGRRLMLALGVIAMLLLAAFAVTMLFHQENGTAPERQGSFIICIDPGHGGSDVGAVSPEGRQEKDDVFALAQAVEGKLATMISSLPEDAGEVQVILTRHEDDSPSLEDRYTYANNQNASIFISLHRNSGGGKGVEVWIQNAASKEEKRLGQTMLDKLASCEINGNRGLRYGTPTNSEADFAVNKGTLMPACLIELGFMDYEADNRLFDENIDAYAQAIAEGIMDMR